MSQWIGSWGEVSFAAQDDSTPTNSPPLGPSPSYSETLDEAIHAAEHLLMLAPRGSLRRSASTTQHNDAASNIATILRAVLTIAKTHRIPLESCVMRRIRLLSLEYPIPDCLIAADETRRHRDAEGASGPDESARLDGGGEVDKSALLLPPIAQQSGGSVRGVLLSSRTSTGSQPQISLQPSQSMEDAVGDGTPLNASGRRASGSSMDDVRASTTNRTGSTQQTTSTHTSTVGGGKRSLIQLLSHVSQQSDNRSDHCCDADAAAAGHVAHVPLTQLAAVASPPLWHGPRSHQHHQHNNLNSVDGRTGSSAVQSSLSTPSTHQPNNVASYIDAVLVADDTPLCDPAGSGAAALMRRSGSIEADPIHAEYVRDGMWLAHTHVTNSSFGVVSPMTPADVLRQSLCDNIPGAAQSISSLKQSYRELLQLNGSFPHPNTNHHNNQAGSANGGSSGGGRVGGGGSSQQHHRNMHAHHFPRHVVPTTAIPQTGGSLSANTSHDNLVNISEASGEFGGGEVPGAGAAGHQLPDVTPSGPVNHLNATTMVPTSPPLAAGRLGSSQPQLAHHASPQPSRPSGIDAPSQPTSAAGSRARSTAATHYISTASRAIPTSNGQLRVAYGLELLRQAISS